MSINQATTVRRIHPNPAARFAEGLIWFAILAVIGVILLIIPPIGIFVLLCAFIAPVYCVLMADSRDKLVGPCPYCGNEIRVLWQKARKRGFNCKWCKRRLFVQGVAGDERFMGVQ